MTVKYRIRALEPTDIRDVNEIRAMRGVMETIPTLFSEPLSHTEAVIRSFGSNDHMLAAEVDTDGVLKVAALGGLHVAPKHRMRHSADISLIVHTDYQNMGIGRAILTQLLELADKWLLLKRVELEVAAENSRAIHLYEALGFEREGLKKYATITDGKLTDIVIMGRYRNLHIR